ncbi:MAG TPA: type II toxin-antitoxin system VapC family toxin [Candidatus Sulfotelmatobacter sp.]|nr:type II toxin-antitoxin system VapC family toxin [Candidatus Sulfotelmatobacter sp.]
MSRIFWDTNLFIYLFEDYGRFSKAVVRLRSNMLERGDQLLTSTLTLGEILVKPAERRDTARCAHYERAIRSAAILIPFDVEAARKYADLRTDRAIKAPDAIQLACAAAAGTDLFITNDERLRGKHVTGIQFIVQLERAPV